MRLAPLFAATCLFASAALAITPADVPKPPRGRWSLDLSGRIRRETLTNLDRLAGTLDAQRAGQLGVAVIDSTSGASPRDFATNLFNRWGVGRAGRNDGILLFVALGDRKAEIILGDGLTDIPTFETDRIMADDIVANFRRGDPDAALTAGADSLAALLFRRVGGRAPAPAVDPGVVAEPPSSEAVPADVEELHAILVGRKPFPNPRPRGWVVDLEGRLDKPTLSAINQVGDEVYAAGRGRLYAVVFRSAPRYAPAEEVAALAQKEFSPSAGENLYLVVASTNPRELKLAVPPLIEADADGARELSRIRASCGLDDLSREPGQAVQCASQAMGKLALEGPPVRSTAEVVAAGAKAHATALFSLLGATGLGGLFALKRYLRRRPRRCLHCNSMRELLNEQADDVHLTAGQKKEEQLASVDYDVWWCAACRDALVLSYQAWFSGYSKCAKCAQVTAASQSQTLVSATYDHGGTVQVTETCKFCNHVRSYQRHTARLTRSSTSSSSSSRSSSSSFGGGSSSGRGSSGSW
jgi:uncharacterized protein